jgi:hypothetical protein
MEIVWLSHFIENSRQKFHELMEKYPRGEIPEEISLIPAYIAIKDKKCCGIVDNAKLNVSELFYFYQNFEENCDVRYRFLSRKSNYDYQ